MILTEHDPVASMASDRKRLLECFDRLDERGRGTLVDYAEYLAARAEPKPIPEPEPIPRPEQERVVAAMRRLTATYPMLDRAKVLGEASNLLSQHVLEGRDAVEVIDELEVIFRRHYDALQTPRS